MKQRIMGTDELGYVTVVHPRNEPYLNVPVHIEWSYEDGPCGEEMVCTASRGERHMKCFIPAHDYPFKRESTEYYLLEVLSNAT